MEWGDTIWTGLFLENDRPSLDSLEPVNQGPPIARRPLGLTDEQAQGLLAKMM